MRDDLRLAAISGDLANALRCEELQKEGEGVLKKRPDECVATGCITAVGAEKQMLPQKACWKHYGIILG